MTSNKCTLCFHPAAEVPVEYRSFLYDLTAIFLQGISSTKYNWNCTIRFCSSCRNSLVKFFKLNQKLACLVTKNNQFDKGGLVRITTIKQRSGRKTVDAGCRKDLENADALDCVIIENINEDDATGTCPIQVARTEDDRNLHEDKSVKLAETGLKCVVDPLEDNWVPKNASEEQLLKELKQVSDKEYLFRGKYSFERTDFTFKCGSCPAKSKICLQRGLPIWYDAVRHIKTVHANAKIPKRKRIDDEFIEVSPNQFKYGNIIVQKFDDEYRCGVCGHFSPMGARLKFTNIALHIRRQHKNQGENYMCEVCGRQFRSLQYLKCHRINQHEHPYDPHSCSTCGKTYKNSFYQSCHEKKIHEGYFKYICEICGQKFKTSGFLKDHIMVAHEGKKFECRDCGKMFSRRIGLNVHKNSHTGRRKYACDICGMNFTQSYAIKRHKKTAYVTVDTLEQDFNSTKKTAHPEWKSQRKTNE